MSDYSSLKVVELKKVLKERSLPVSGNKADLIKRLEDADEAENAAAEPHEPEPEPEPEPQTAQAVIDANEAQPEDDVSHDQNESSEKETSNATKGQITASQTNAQSEEAERADHEAAKDLPNVEITPTSQQVYETSTDIQGTIDNETPLIHTDTPAEARERPGTTDAKSAAAATLQAANDMIKDSITPEESKLASREGSNEVLKPDQSRRRKRSRTPTPDEEEIHKKLKSAEGEIKITLPEDVGESTVVEAKTEPRSSVQVPEQNQQAEIGNQTRSDNAEVPLTDPLVESGASEIDKPLEKEQQNGSKRGEQVEEKKVGQRDVAPARHPPTRVLYVKNLKRPLQPAALKQHLESLGDQAESGAQDVVTAFFIDQFRTHCFTKFGHVEQASRARDELHGQAWPDERSKDTLWVDFIPEDKFDDWVKIEEESKGQKRWQVLYETEKWGVVAKLTDASESSSKNDDKSKAAPVPPSPESKSKAPPRDDRARGFKTLDDLFHSTAAKPKIYFLPVNQEIVNRRLDELAKGRGGVRKNGEARFTFEDGSKLVDDGPDTGLKLDRPRGFVGGQNRPPPPRAPDRRYRDNRR